MKTSPKSSFLPDLKKLLGCLALVCLGLFGQDASSPMVKIHIINPEINGIHTRIKQHINPVKTINQKTKKHFHIFENVIWKFKGSDNPAKMGGLILNRLCVVSKTEFSLTWQEFLQLGSEKRSIQIYYKGLENFWFEVEPDEYVFELPPAESAKAAVSSASSSLEELAQLKESLTLSEYRNKGLENEMSKLKLDLNDRDKRADARETELRELQQIRNENQNLRETLRQQTKELETLPLKMSQCQLEIRLLGIPKFLKLPIPQSSEAIELAFLRSGSFLFGLAPQQVSQLMRKSGETFYLSEEVPEDRQPQNIPHHLLMGRFEITNQQFAAAVSDHVYPEDQAQFPACNLGLSKIETFLERLQEGYPNLDIRLPTELEWEYAAKRASDLAYPWGAEFSNRMANVGSHKLKAVGSQPEGKSWSDIEDLVGNVSELCTPSHRLYGEKASGEPFVTRGGSYLSPKESSRVTARHLIFNPTQPEVGFRIVVSARNQ